MVRASCLAEEPTYRRREPEKSALYAVLADHLATFLEGEERNFPAFVVRELRAFLQCGILAHGFVRVFCPSCQQSALVAFSCKGRGFCPSCCGRRMADTAAHLVDRVLPEVPVRQWVLTLPHSIRYCLAYDAGLLRDVRRIFMRTILSFYRRRALALDIHGGKSGAVVCVQRFGSALNLNPQEQCLALSISRISKG